MRHVIPFLALLLATPAGALTVGALRVEVLDAEGLPVPAASLELSCAHLVGGTRVTQTDFNGVVEFDALAPGACDLTVTHAALSDQSIQNIRIDVNRTTRIRVELTGGEIEEIAVVGGRAVKTEATSRRSVLTRKFLRRVPQGRSYQSTVNMAAGVQQGRGSNPSIGGAAVNTNTYVQPTGEHYVDHGVGEAVQTGSDHLSTFAVDVDTASYAISRRKLNQGYLPPVAAVRAEEFVNALHYGYAAPTDRPIAVRTALASHPVKQDAHVLRVGLKAEAAPAREPLRLTFLVDTSGSMSSPDKLGLAQKALLHLVDQLGPEDRVAIATYAGSTRVALEPTWTTRKDRIRGAIRGLTSGGGTAMDSGMDLAYGLASDMFLDGVENRVVVLSDGDANIGRTGIGAMLATIRKHAEEGITLTTVGFGTGNYQDHRMEQLANKGDGNHFYIDSFREAQEVFGDDLTATLRTVARDTKVQVDFDPRRVRSWRLIGYENRAIADHDFREDAVDAGEVGSGHTVTALYELELTGLGGALGEVHIRAKPPGTVQVAQEWVTAIEEPEPDSDLFRAWVVGTFAEKLRHSDYAADVSWEDLQTQAQEHLTRSEEDAELLDLIERAAELSRGRFSRR